MNFNSNSEILSLAKSSLPEKVCQSPPQPPFLLSVCLLSFSSLSYFISWTSDVCTLCSLQQHMYRCVYLLPPLLTLVDLPTFLPNTPPAPAQAALDWDPVFCHLAPWGDFARLPDKPSYLMELKNIWVALAFVFCARTFLRPVGRGCEG